MVLPVNLAYPKTLIQMLEVDKILKLRLWYGPGPKVTPGADSALKG